MLALFKIFADGISSINKKKWRKEKVRCCDCGHTWNCVFPNFKNGEYSLECPKCGHRNSELA